MDQRPQNLESLLSPEKLSVGLPWKLFIFAVILFGTVLAAYFGLLFGYKPFLNSRINDVNQKIQNLAQSIPAENQKNFLLFYSQVANLKNLLGNHIIFTKFFPFLERNTNKRVALSVSTVDASRKELILEGIAESYAILAEQLQALNQATEVKEYLLNQSQLSDGRIRFRISAILDARIFK